MASFNPMNVSINRSFISCADVTFNKQDKIEPSLADYQSIEFIPVFPSFPMEFTAFTTAKEIVTIKEKPENKPYIDFRCPSAHRQFRVDVFDQEGHGTLYVNLNDIKNVSIGLYEKITTVTQSKKGMIYKEGEIGAGVWEFEVLLRLICNSYQGISRTTVLAKYMKRMLILSSRYDISSLVEECKQVVAIANYSQLHGSQVKLWYEGFESSRLDEFQLEQDDMVARPMRAHIISEMINYKRWKDLFRFVPAKWLRVLKQRALPNIYLASYDVDICIHENFGESRTHCAINDNQQSYF